MNVKLLRADLVVYLEKHHPKLHSFRIDRKYRVIFGVAKDGKVEIIDINDHYR